MSLYTKFRKILILSVTKYPIILMIPNIDTKSKISAGGYAAFFPLKKNAMLKMAQKNAIGMKIYNIIS
jgi:hypothetical protein